MCFSVIFAKPVSYLDNWGWVTLVSLIFYFLLFLFFLWYSSKAFLAVILNCRTLCLGVLNFLNNFLIIIL